MEITKEYFDARIDAVLDRLEKIEENQSDIYKTLGRLRELIGNNDTEIKRIHDRLDNGQKAFDYIRRDINGVKKQPCLTEEQITYIAKIPGMAVREKIMWSVFGGVTVIVGGYILNQILSGI